MFLLQSAVTLISSGAQHYGGRTLKDVVDELADSGDMLDAMHADQDHQAQCPGCEHCRALTKRDIN